RAGAAESVCIGIAASSGAAWGRDGRDGAAKEGARAGSGATEAASEGAVIATAAEADAGGATGAGAGGASAIWANAAQPVAGARARRSAANAVMRLIRIKDSDGPRAPGGSTGPDPVGPSYPGAPRAGEVR